MTVPDSLTIEARNGRVFVAGELDTRSAWSLCLAAIRVAAVTVELDLSRVTFIDGRGLRALLLLRHALSVRVVAASAQVLRLLEVTGTIAAVFGTEQETTAVA
jgi:anti-anti-sigma factor